jgi:hypothetical protein
MIPIPSFPSHLYRLKSLCQGRPEAAEWLEDEGWLGFCVLWLFGGLFLYGFAIGWWRAPLQAWYGAVKTPFLMALTLSGTAVANWMMAQLLGAALPFRQTLLIQLMGYVVLVTILLSLIPLAFFVDCTVPSSLGRAALVGQAVVTFFQVFAVAGSGIASHIRLFHLIQHACHNRSLARWLLLIWMANNLFLGSHLSWYFRPFIGNPSIPVEFFSKVAFVQGSFFSDLTEKAGRLY